MALRWSWWLFIAVAPVVHGELVLNDVRWGFEQRVLPGSFTQLALRVSNSGTSAFEGFFVLERATLLQSRVGGQRTSLTVRIEPGASRWVRFFPFVYERQEHWTVRWIDAGGSSGTLLSQHVFEDAAGQQLVPIGEQRVELVANAMRRQVSELRAFPAELFPPTALAATTLHSVVLDHAPPWPAVTARAFLDWLASGGTLHLVDGEDGRPPMFSAELALLQDPSPRFTVGAGKVVRHPRREATLAVAELNPVSKPRAAAQADHLTQHVLVSLGYLLLVGPGGYLIARWRGPLELLGYYVVLIAGCATVLGFLGARGYDEVPALHWVALARPVMEQRLAVEVYGNAFTTETVDIELTLASPLVLADDADIRGPTAVALVSGPGGSLQATLPLYTSRAFLLAGTLAVEAPRLFARGSQHVELHGLAADRWLAGWISTDHGDLRSLDPLPSSPNPTLQLVVGTVLDIRSYLPVQPWSDVDLHGIATLLVLQEQGGCPELVDQLQARDPSPSSGQGQPGSTPKLGSIAYIIAKAPAELQIGGSFPGTSQEGVVVYRLQVERP
jgi:hypothetical protein